MSDIALRFIIANLAASAAILIVLALRKPVRLAFGARVAYALWLLAPLAALGSMLPPRVVEIVRPMIAAPAPDLVSAPISPIAEIAPSLAPALASTPDSAPSPVSSLDPWAIGALVWLIGVLATIGWLARNQWRFMADARAGFAGPAVAGFFRPRIVTPSDFEERFDRSERDVILAHETIHLSGNDARINAAVALARCLAWFNPLVHIGAHVMRIDQELACDATVVARHPRAKAVYASALLKAQLAARPLPLGCYWPAGEDHPLTERIEMLKRTAPGRVRRLAGAGAVLLLAAAAGAAAWAAKPPATRIIEQQQTAEVAPTPAPAPQQTPAPGLQQTPVLAPPQAAPQQAAPGNPHDYVAPPVKLDVNAPLFVRGKVEAIDFGPTSYVVRLRATGISNIFRSELGNGRRDQMQGYAEPNTALWELSPTNFFGDANTIRADLMGKDIEVQGFNINNACKPDCRIKATDVFTPRSTEVRPPGPGDSLISFFTFWYDAGARFDATGTVERIEFSDRTFDFYIRTRDRGPWEQSRLVQARSEYHYPRADIERELLGKTATATGWSARGPMDTYCAPICGMYADMIWTGDIGIPRAIVTPAGPVLSMAIPARPAAAGAPGQPPSGALRLVALRRERLEVSSRDVAKFVDRYFEPGEEYSTFGLGNDWTISTPDGSAFEWRFRDTSLGPLTKSGPVRALNLDEAVNNLKPAVERLTPPPAAPQGAPDQPRPVISRILVEGNVRIPASTILSYVLLKPGDQLPVIKDRIDQSFKALIDTGLFSNVQFIWQGNDLVVRVVEKPAAPPAPAKPQPTRYEPQQIPGVPQDFVPFASLFDADDPIRVKGKVTQVDMTQPYIYLWLQASEATEKGKPGLQPNAGVFRAMLGRTDSAIDGINTSLVGKEVTVRGYRAKDKTCTDSCLIKGLDVTIDGVKQNVTPGVPTPTIPLKPIRYEPQQGSQQAPLRITSNTSQYLQSEGRAVYTGNVQATQGDLQLSTDNLTVTCRTGASGCEEIQALVAESNVVFTDPDISIRCDRAEYDPKSGVISFSGNIISSKGGVIRGSKLAYTIGKKEISITPN